MRPFTRTSTTHGASTRTSTLTMSTRTRTKRSHTTRHHTKKGTKPMKTMTKRAARNEKIVTAMLTKPILERAQRAREKSAKTMPKPVAPTAPAPTPEAARGGLQLLDRSVALSVTWKRLGISRRLSSSAVEVAADKDM